MLVVRAADVPTTSGRRGRPGPSRADLLAETAGRACTAARPWHREVPRVWWWRSEGFDYAAAVKQARGLAWRQTYIGTAREALRAKG